MTGTGDIDSSCGKRTGARGWIALLLALALVCVAPAAASAVTAAGGLQQLPTPNDCVSSSPTSNCGTIVNGGLGAARSVAVTPDRANAYVASTTGSLTTFGRNEASGALSFTSCLKDPSSTEACPTNSNRPLAGAAWVVATDGFVYVAAQSANAVTVFQRVSDTGALTPIGCISQTGANSAGGPPCATSPGLTGVERLARSADGKSLYAVSSSNSTLATLNINAGTGLLTAGGCLRGTTSPDVTCATSPTPTPGLNGANGVDVAPDGKTVYVTATSGGASNVSYLTSYSRDATTGALTPSQCFHSIGAQSSPDTAAPPCNAPPGNTAPISGLDGADGVRVSPDNTNVYVASGASGPSMGNSLVTFNRNTTNGNLTSARCLHDPASSAENCPMGTDVVGLKGAFDIGITPSGKSLYVTARAGNDVAEFSRNTGTGDLAQLAGADKCIGRQGNNTDCAPNNTAKGLNGASGISVSSDGLFAYVAAPGDSAVSEFRIEAPPVCSNVGPIATPHDQPVTFTLPCSDPNPGEAVTCTIDSQPTNGTVTQSSPGSCTVTFTPTTGASGADSFTYHATDAAGQSSNIATASVNVQPAGTPTVTISDQGVAESAGTMTFQLTLSSPVGTPVVVNYSTRDGSATAPSDYTARTAQTATFPANQTTTTITVPIVNDNVHEGTEQFFVDLTGTSAGTAIARPTATGTIADDDATAVNIGDVTVNENDGDANFTVSLSNPSESTVDVTYSTVNGSAVAPGDFTAQSSKTVSFAPGEVSKLISVPIVDDTTPEQTEQFGVVLSSPTGGASLGKTQGVGTITDDDAPALSVSDASVSEGNSGTRNASFTVSLSAAISRAVTVSYSTADGSATTADGDYAATTGTLTFNAGETSKTVNVAVNGDTKPEPDETFTLGLSGAANATIANGTGTGTILDDDSTVTQAGLFVSDTAVSEGDSGKRDANFTVSLTSAATSEVKVDYATADGTATAGSDYDSTSGTLTFAPGETSKTVAVQVHGDRRFEPDETFTLKLTNARGAPLSKDAGTGTIANDDTHRLKLRGLSFSVRPARDRTAPFTFTVSGKLRLPAGVTKAKGCRTGTVRVRYIASGARVSSRTARVSGSCTFRVVTTFRDARRIPSHRLRVQVRFSGNAALLPFTARTKGARVG